VVVLRIASKALELYTMSILVVVVVVVVVVVGVVVVGVVVVHWYDKINYFYIL